MESSELQGAPPQLQRWDSNRYLRKMNAEMVRLSRGFLRCRVERWFPGFAAQWLPLAHSLGVELRVVEMQPQLSAPKGLSDGFAGSVDGELIGILMDEASSAAIVECFAPGAVAGARGAILEYLARRYLSSLALAWSGPESSVVQFDGGTDPFSLREAGAVKLGLLVNNKPATVWITLGPQGVERLDGLWRRQVRSTAKATQAAGPLSLEIAQLAVAPALLADYMRSGTMIDLEIAMSDLCTLRQGVKPWLPGRLCDVGGKLGVEIVSGAVSSISLPEGTTRLAIDFGSFDSDAATLSEISQVGAVVPTEISVGDVVHMIVNGDRVRDAVLCTYEGRFALSVM